MLRTNLSTRPFYNERVARAVLAACALLLLLLTAFNVIRAAALWRSETTLSARATDARAEAARLRSDAERIRARVDPKELAAVSSAAAEANALIEQRAFSWVQLLTRLESTLPDRVRITSMQPSIEDGEFKIRMVVEAHTFEELSMFMESLESQGTFRRVLAPVSSTADDGIIDATIEGTYVGAAADIPAAPTAGGTSGRAPGGGL
jgi:Tfp pilus assembly protein PilN